LEPLGKLSYLSIPLNLKLDIWNFALIGNRLALANLERIDRIDDMQERNVFVEYSPTSALKRALSHDTNWGTKKTPYFWAPFYKGC